MRSALALLLVGAALALASTIGGAGSGDAVAEPAPSTLLVVQANLQDSVRPADARDERDLDTFADRVAAVTPRPPDALLLTELLGPGAERIARRLSRATGAQYRVAVAPGRSAFLPDGGVRESAILVNAGTLRLAEHGFRRVQSEDQAYAVVADRGAGAERLLVSAHVAGDPLPAADALDDADVLGGDMRNSRCAVQTDDQAIDCAPQPYWDLLTLDRGYSDALFEAGDAPARKRSATIFARGTVERAFVDAAYHPGACKAPFDEGRSRSAPAACRDTYYADAPFGWALIGPAQPVQRAVVPATAALDHCELATRKAAVLARVVNNTDAAVTDTVSASAPAPLNVAVAPSSLEVPPGQARTAAVRITAPRATPTGEYPVEIGVGPHRRTVPVTVTPDCIEPRAYATSYHAGFEPEKAIDGDIATFWHSEYSPPTPLPQSLTLNLGEPRQVSQLGYQPRFDGNLNGTILDYNVSVSADGETFTQVASGSWAADARVKTATFAAVEARYVRLEATRALNGSYASAAEVTVE